MVITVPASLVVERKDEQLAPLDLGDEVIGIRHASNGGTDVGAKATKYHRSHQEPANRFRQGGKNLFLQVAADGARRTAERLDQVADTALPAQRDRHHLQSCGPTLGTVAQRVDVARA